MIFFNNTLNEVTSVRVNGVVPLQLTFPIPTEGGYGLVPESNNVTVEVDITMNASDESLFLNDNNGSHCQNITNSGTYIFPGIYAVGIFGGQTSDSPC